MVSELGFSPPSSHRVRRTFAFIDLCGFTAYNNTQGDEASVAQLAAFRAIVRAVASATGVRVAKWLGDGAMLVGLDSAGVVSAVLEVCRRMRAEGIELALHAGVAEGPVILFEGDDHIGQSVNLAARLAELSGPWQVLGPADLVPGLAGTGAVMGALEVAGWDQPVVVADLARAVTLVEALNL
jgi:adenylate cyclase